MHVNYPELGSDMCDRCRELDRELKNFRRQQKIADDRFALFLIAEVIANLETEKASLHPEEKEKE
jgi:hypothetical protein